MRLKFNADSKLTFQIGDPIDHSTAAFLINTMYDLANVDAVCMPLHVKRGHLPEFVDFVRKLDIAGFSITMPHKSDVIPLLDECDEASRLFNSVNVVKNENGRLIGIGLDGVGMGTAIAHTIGDMTGKTALMIGAGSISGPIAADLCKRGVNTVHIVNRTVEKAEKIAETIGKALKVKVSAGPMENSYLKKICAETDIAVQCTSLGMAGSNQQFETLDFMEALPETALCADVLYPTTGFLEKAKSRGLMTVNGMAMLLYQMIEMIDFRFGIKLPPESLKIAEESLTCAVALRELRDRRLSGEDKI